MAQSSMTTNVPYGMTADSNFIPSSGEFVSFANKIGDIYGVSFFIRKTVNVYDNSIINKAVYLSGYTNGIKMGFIMADELPKILKGVMLMDSLVKLSPDRLITYNLGLEKSGFSLNALYDFYGETGSVKWYIFLILDKNRYEDKISLKISDLPGLRKLFENAIEKLKNY